MTTTPGAGARGTPAQSIKQRLNKLQEQLEQQGGPVLAQLAAIQPAQSGRPCRRWGVLVLPWVSSHACWILPVWHQLVQL